MTTEFKQANINWSNCGHVCFVDGWGWVVSEDLNNIRLGKEEDIKKIFETGELPQELTRSQRKFLLDIQEYRKELKGGRTGEGSLERRVASRTARNNKRPARQITSRKRISLRSSRPANKIVSS